VHRLLVIARRDLAAYFHGPSGALVAGLFLALQGTVFWLFVRFLGRPDAPPGGLFEFFFGGTLLYWVAVALLATVVPMRLLAEETRSGTIETLLTAPVRFGEVVVGKWLAALAFYALLWAPTLLYLPFLRHVGAPLDAGAVASGYLGTLLVGAAALAIGLAASAATRNQLLAAAGSFVVFFLLLLVGLLHTQVAGAAAAAVLRRASLFRIMEDFGHGVVDSRAVVLLGTLTVLALAAATGLTGRGRPATGRRPMKPGGGLSLALSLVAAALALGIAVMVNVLAARHYVRGDWTSSRLYSLSPKTVAVMQALPRPVSVTVFLYPRRESEEDRAVASLLRELLLRLQRHAGDRLLVEYVDPDRAPERAEQARRTHGISPHELSQGVVVVSSGARARFIPRDDLADEELDLRDGTRRLRAFRGEAALLSAVETVTSDRTPAICFAQGHGEPDASSLEDAGYGTFADDLRREAFEVRRQESLVALATAGCDALVIAEPQVAYTPAELAALERHLDGGGRLLLMLGPVFDRSGRAFRQLGIEGLTARFGIRFQDALVVDPVRARDMEGPSTWVARDASYGRHPVTARLEGRPTTWARVRPLAIVPPPPPPPPGSATTPAPPIVLVRSGPESWGETDLATIRGDADVALDAGRDARGPLPVAAAVEAAVAVPAGERPRPPARLVVVGTGRLLDNSQLAGLLVRDFNRDLGLSAVAWLVDRPERAGIGPKVPAELRAVIDVAAADRAFQLFVIGLPLAAVALALVVWRRRRV
jgi:ABC-2 type transport system permease protein